MTARAGTVLHAPQARLVDVSSGRVIGTNVQTVSLLNVVRITQTAVGPDILSAQVTLPNTGIGQLEVVLNNQRFDGNGRPTFPPWKYNDFSAQSERAQGAQDDNGTYALSFGQRLRLDLRYGAGAWVKMILARITNLEFTFPTSGAQVKVVAEDLLSALKVRPDADHPYPSGRQEEDLLDDVLRRASAGIDQERSTRSYRRPRNRGLPAIRHQKSKTFWQFISSIAERMDAELYVDFVERQVAESATPGAAVTSVARSDQAQPIDVRREVKVRFEPRRSTIPPATREEDWTARERSGGNDRYIELRWGRSLVSFAPKFKVWEMPTSADASGARPGRRGRARGRISASDVQTAIGEELHVSPAYAAPAGIPVDAITARNQFFGDANDAEANSESSPGSNLDENRTQLNALAKVLKKVREFMTVSGSTIGIPKLRPGAHVHIVGLRPPFDGFYYVVKTVHTLDGNGYRTEFSLERPGMLPPGQYMTPSREEQQRSARGAVAREGGTG